MDISVVIPAKNEQKYIKRAINSVKEALNNTNYTYQIIVCNNNSTDKTAKIAKQHGVKVVNQSIYSISKTRNKGASVASGNILIFLDADSLLSYKLVNRSVKLLNKNKKVVSAITSFTHYPTLKSRGVVIYNLLSVFFKLGVGQFIAIKKDSFKKVGGFNESYYAFEEIELFKQIKKKYGFNSASILLTPVKSSPRKFTKKGKDTKKFLYQLFLAVIGTKIGTKKKSLSFWYD